MTKNDLTPEQRATLMLLRLDFALSGFKNGQHIDRQALKEELVKQFEAAEKRGIGRLKGMSDK